MLTWLKSGQHLGMRNLPDEKACKAARPLVSLLKTTTHTTTASVMRPMWSTLLVSTSSKMRSQSILGAWCSLSRLESRILI